MMKLNGLRNLVLFVAAGTGGVAALAQTVSDPAGANLSIPLNTQFLGNSDPSVHKATAIVNGAVITETDVNQRVALILISNNTREISPQEMQQLRAQTLRALVDETLQIQAAESQDIKITQKELDTYFAQVARNQKTDAATFAAELRQRGSSDKALKRQLHGQLAWRQLQSRRIAPFVNIADEEVKAIIDRMTASKGTEEYKVSEIFLSATPETSADVRASADRIIQQIRAGASFAAFARQFSEASTAAQGGDLSWIRAERLPEELSGPLKVLGVGQVSTPIPVAGGFSILFLEDKRKVLVADARDAVLSLKQLMLKLPANTTQQEAQAKVNQLVEAGKTMGGCGGADAAAARIGATVGTRDDMKVRDFPPQMQQAMMSLNIGEATPPFGNPQEGVAIIVLCGRDDPAQAAAPNFDQIYGQIEEQRLAARAQRYLRDLRRDAVVEYR
jgi:peptidyl-prolyl cis-trans isomerase SurA